MHNCYFLFTTTTQTRGNGRPPCSFDGTLTQASPSSTSSSPTEQVQANRARDFSGISSATDNFDIDRVTDLHRRAEIQGLRNIDRARPRQPRAEHRAEIRLAV